MENSNPVIQKVALNSRSTQMLQTSHIELIENALQQIGDYGEVRLVIEKGRLRYIEVAKSMDVLKLQDLA